MNAFKITTAAAILALGVSTLASAQPRDPRFDRRDDHRPTPQVVHPAPHGGPRHGPPQRPAGWHEGRGAGPDHRFYRGDRMPPAYRGRQYVVNDWRGHHLNAPPRGYNWVQTGADYALVAIATGVIAQIILGN